MGTRVKLWSIVLLLLCVPVAALAQEMPPMGTNYPAYFQPPADRSGVSGSSDVLFQPPPPTGIDDPLLYSNNSNGGEEEPGHIRDNAFLVEEAFNQGKGEVQHIFNWIHLWDHPASGRTRDFAFAYTMELPLGSQKHQFSFTTQFLTGLESPVGGAATQEGGVGDTFLNYRYQLLSNDDFLWCAPRATLIVPTGDKRFGGGTGEVGYQFNLPVSRYGERFDFHFNAGLTYTPGVSVALASGLPSPNEELWGYNLGVSAFWKPRVDLNFFVEMLYLRNEGLDEFGVRDPVDQVFANPGVRYAVCQLDQVEWIIGLSSPIGLTRDTPDIGVFAYMSVEHLFRNVDEEAE